VEDIQPREVRLLPGLPEDMAFSYSDLKRRPHGHGPPTSSVGGPHGPKKMGPPKLGNQPPWVDEIEGVIALLINTCEDLEHPFIHYLSQQIEKPVWGMGPLLPEQYWKLANSLLHDHQIRTHKKSNITEEKVNQWLDSKSRGSILYVSFGSELGPTMEES
jgi:hypothetical protein